MNKFYVTGSLAALLLIILGTRQAAAEWESVVFGINDFDCSDCCDGDDLSWSVDTADDMDTGFEAIGYDQTNWYSNKHVDGKDWTDDLRRVWGVDHDDPYGTDWADAAAIITHGASACGDESVGGYWSYVVMGQYHDGTIDCDTADCQDCRIFTNNYLFEEWRSGHMRFGGGSGEELNVLILGACQSMQKCVWDNGGYNDLDNGGEALKIVNGFHGDSHRNSTSGADYRQYVTYAKYHGIGDDWVDKLTQYIGGEKDCATSLVWGSSSSKREDFFYHAGFKDLKDTGAHTNFTTFYIGGCDPVAGAKLPE